MKITVVGSGYVGTSLSVLLSKEHKVKILDIDQDRVNAINSGKNFISDSHIDEYIESNNISLFATTEANVAYEEADFVIIATPTDFDDNKKSFNTDSVDSVVSECISLNKEALIVIKSTIPIGHTNKLNVLHNTNRIVFSPEFLREGTALFDNMHPTRIIIGSSCEKSKEFSNILKSLSLNKDVKILHTSSDEAEAIKLFSNTYLAMRISFFNELDSFAYAKNLNTANIIEGLSLDERIGSGYNNPSLGYGGYCLPKDTKQLESNFIDIPQEIISSIISSNATRKNFITSEILSRKPNVVGFYRLIMKKGSDNFRSSAIRGIIKRIQNTNIKILVYEPLIEGLNNYDFEVTNNLSIFKEKADVIVANRFSKDLSDIKIKLICRDIFGEN